MARIRTKVRNRQSHEVSNALLSIKSHYRFNNAKLRIQPFYKTIQEELAYKYAFEEEALFEQQLLAEFHDRVEMVMSDDKAVVVNDHEFADFISEYAPEYEVRGLSKMERLEKVYQV
jgi:hypothetical protein